MTDDMKKLQLELGGSFFELIEFSLTRRVRGRPIKGVYGVNVAKVREVVRLPKINPLASRIKGIAGVFELRGIPIPAVHLSAALGDDETELKPNQQIIVTEFSQKRAGFIVEQTHRIRRVAWEKVLPPSADAATCINGMTLIENNEFLFILDLEKVLITLEAASGSPSPYAVAGAAEMAPAPRGPATYDFAGYSVLLVDDSAFIRNGVKQALVREGMRVVEAGDGSEALRILSESMDGGKGGFDIVVSDVEMPRMDGLTFTRRVRENAALAQVPIILHTSLSGKANQAAGLAAGANGYVVKNDLRSLFELLREILGSGGGAHGLSA